MSRFKLPSLVASLVLAAGSWTAPAITHAAVNVDIDIAPPAPRVEVVPQARHGYVWAPGHYEWRRRSHVWVTGHWIRERRGYHWAPDEWVQVGPRWHYAPGHWVRG